MKLEWILVMIIPAFFSIDAILLSNFRFFIELNLLWSFITGVSLAVISLILWCFLAEGIYLFLERWPRLRDWLIKKRLKDDPWMKRIYCYRYWGLFFGGFAPAISIPAQKIFQFKYGYWALFGGNIAKVLLIVSIIKIFGYFT